MRKRNRWIAAGALAALLLTAGLVIVRRTDVLVLFNTPEPDPTIGQPVKSARVLFIGHSLVGSALPQMIGTFAAARAKSYATHGQLGWGTSLKAHWEWDGAMNDAAPLGFPRDNRAPFFAGEAKAQLDSGAYDVLVLIESTGHTTIDVRETVAHATRFVERARKRNPSLRAYVYTGWLDRKEAPSLAAWREQIRADRGWWERVADGVSARVAGPDAAVIPGAAILADVTEAIERGEIPDIGNVEELFGDTVHLNAIGFYVIALAHYAAIFRDDPRGLPAVVVGENGEQVDKSPTPAAAAALQALVWRHLQGYPRAAISR
jgi:hypothetical protein